MLSGQSVKYLDATLRCVCLIKTKEYTIRCQGAGEKTIGGRQ